MDKKKIFLAKVVLAKSTASLGGPLLQLLLVYILPLSAVGKFNSTLAISMAVAVYIRGGMDIIALREASDLWRSGKKNLVMNVVRYSVKKIIIRALLSAFVILLLIQFFEIFFIESWPRYLFIHLYAMLFSFIMVFSSILKSIENVVIGAWVEQGQTLFIATFLALIGINLVDDPEDIYFLVLVSAVILFFFSSTVLRFSLRGEKTENLYMPTRYKGERTLFLVSAIAYMSQWGVILVFDHTYSDAETGAFSVALRLGMALNFILMVSNQFVIPKISYLCRSKKYKEMEDLVRRIINILSFLSISLFIMSLGLYLTVNLNQDQDLIARMGLVVLFGQAINVSSGATGYLLSLTGKEGLLLKSSLVGAVLGVSLMFLSGLVGLPAIFAVCAYALIPITTTAISVFYIKRNFDFYSVPKFW